MSSSSSNSLGSSDAGNFLPPGESACKGPAVKTFAFEVTAGRPAQPGDAELPLLTAPKPKYLAHLPLTEDFQQPLQLQPAKQTQAEDQENLWQFTLVPARPQPRRRKSAWWTASLGLHAVVILALSIPTLVTVRQQDNLDLYASATSHDSVDELHDFDIEQALPTLESELALELEELASFAELSGESPLEDPLEKSSESAFADLVPIASEASFAEEDGLAELGRLFGPEGNGMTDLETGAGGATVNFFGTKVQAKRILYMLDNSGGMRHGGKFETLLSELRKSVHALKKRQQFYVVFYSDTVYPLYYPDSVRRFVAATDENRQQLDRWLDSVEFCTGNAIDEAFAATEVIRPDVVFLLTDGNLFTTEKKKAMLLDQAARPYSIHTFGLGVSKNSKTAAGLRQVAEINGGTFRAVRVSDADETLAKQKQRPYHKKQPGAVWGIKVGVRRW